MHLAIDLLIFGREAWEQKLKLFSIAEVPPAAELNTLRTFYDFLEFI